MSFSVPLLVKKAYHELNPKYVTHCRPSIFIIWILSRALNQKDRLTKNQTYLNFAMAKVRRHSDCSNVFENFTTKRY